MSKAIKGLALNDSVRVLAIDSTAIVSLAQQAHQTTPSISIALGKVLAITSLLGMMQKNDDQVLVTINGDGLIGKIHAQFFAGNKIIGYVDNPQPNASLKDNSLQELIGSNGFLNVVYKQNLKTDYQGLVPLVSGEINEDFVYYFSLSEQISSYVIADVIVNKEGHIICSGALIIQLLPQALEHDLASLNPYFAQADQLTNKLVNNQDIETIIREIFPDFKLLVEDKINFECFCSYDNFTSKLLTLSTQDLLEIKKEKNGIEITCPWCNKKYFFTEEMIDKILIQKEKLKSDF